MANFLKSLFKGKTQESNTDENTKSNTDSKNFDIFKYDGIRAQKMGRIDYAIKCYTHALEIKEDFEVMNYLSQIYSHIDELDKAKELLKRMIDIEPEYTPSYLALSSVLFMQEAYDGMIAVLEKAITIEDNNASTHYLLAKAYKESGNADRAIEHLNRTITIQQNFTEAFLMRADIYMEQKRHAESMTDIQRILQTDAEDEQALLLYGKLNERTEKPEEAESAYRQVSELNPFNELAFISLAQLYISQEKLQEAIELCNEAIELNPNSARLYYERGRAKSATGDSVGAERDQTFFEQMASEKEADVEPVQEEKQTNSLGLPFS